MLKIVWIIMVAMLVLAVIGQGFPGFNPDVNRLVALGGITLWFFGYRHIKYPIGYADYYAYIRRIEFPDGKPTEEYIKTVKIFGAALMVIGWIIILLEIWGP